MGLSAVFLTAPVPAPDPIPLPAPWWVFKVLLVITFTLHLLAMNGMLGGAVIALLARLRYPVGDPRRRLGDEMVAHLPSWLAATINLGVAALLFAQVLYGQAFYTSSILMAWPWFLVVPIVIVGYYGFYRASFRVKAGAAVPAAVFGCSTLLFLLVAFIYTNNVTLSLTPGRWAAHYHTDPSGWNLNLADPALLPRYLHFIVGAIAVAGLITAVAGLRHFGADPERTRTAVRHGGRWFMFAAMAQVALGFWFLLALPREQMRIFMGRNMPATIYLAAGVIGTLAAIVLAARAVRAEDPRGKTRAAAVVAGVVLVLMVLMREALRDAYLAEHVQPAAFKVSTQWSPMLLFASLLAGGAALWVWMLVRYARAVRAAGGSD